ncbi:MAG: LysR family transcriptional regulator, partial [Clostridia bacterium]|nr:LysR family transcriptional regulator [Clostridia bacterium]
MIKTHSEREKMRMINIHFLEYIVEFAKTENLTKTSKHLLVSQSALTRAMKNLETYVGVPLFKRSRNKLTLNDTGKEFVKHAETVIEAQKQMVKAT